MTQPAVSAQIKRLQAMLGGDALDKSAPGVSLTQKGQAVVTSARWLLALNDQIVEGAAAAAAPAHIFRVGIALTFGPDLTPFGRFFSPPAAGRIEIRRDRSEDMLNDLADEELDLVVARSPRPNRATMPATTGRNLWRGFGATAPETLTTRCRSLIAKPSLISRVRRSRCRRGKAGIGPLLARLLMTRAWSQRSRQVSGLRSRRHDLCRAN